MTEDIIKKIKQLPPLPESAMKIEAVYQDPDSSFNDMVKILENDPLLTADILKAANSPLYGFSREINAISQAVGLFGMGTVRGFALASIVKKSFSLDLSPYGINNDMFSALSKKQHGLMIAWCLKKENKLLGVLSPAAFLVEIGKVLIAQQIMADKKQEAFRDALLELQDVEAAERQIVGTDTQEVSATVFEHWKFEESLVDVIRNCQHPEQAKEENQRASSILHVVRVAVPINGVLTDESIAKAKELVQKYSLDLESFEHALENAK
ncbi:MAG: HDOD domain-containing protein [Epsilonproteobacteria bacterium]|nr:HDOD domain-containing protein [Campylobacterota bacterium]OIO16668.1 MAG: histidine kinase [Helicobacteraceae bacterium CG1_02_36_14]PIP09820.1 MAG: histidine kinase [Sulfurimonas sp. CG23_combo_of_CG06-09_8_20_14_all_36_33]PIS24035.1 MAG: histidine kinase [Sulfurimonas sp. CG08_land_8_20_14_0_20_36_33]PIU35519.1 MAG: histidine kinase [Sulfurimonas sp. CG07_land_8_20_14_0_80_36_56]PIV05440.1 MAG: histidine kinase [Sulfurimonas sp. CG03_land_8_20_14_0_80_36_25]PIV37081.1 MAG: histidine kin